MGARGRHPRTIPATLHHLVRLFPSISTVIFHPSCLSLLSFILRNFEDEIFVRRVDCNTSFP